MNAIFKYALCLVMAGVLFTSCQEELSNENTIAQVAPQSEQANIIPDQYIITFNPELIKPAISYIDVENLRNREEKATAMEKYNAAVAEQISVYLKKWNIEQEEILHVYTALTTGAALKISPAKFEEIRNQKELIAVDYDTYVSLPDFTVESVEDESSTRAQTTPCGITNAGGAANAGSARWIWVVDTGIDLDHPDLNVVTNTTYAKSFVGGSANDCNGHGTHCAGTAAARNNSIGVIGVAADAPVVPVRVLGCNGSGSTSGIIAGLNHVGTYDYTGDVVNMSLGGYYGSNCANGSSYKTAVQSLGNGGTRVCIAAGNSAGNAALYQPACVNGTRIYTISSMTCSSGWSSFSNYNMNPVDYIATGSSVYSTYLNGGYATLSGTSMATPHVAGICQIRNNAPRKVGTVSYLGESYPIAKR